MKTVFITGGEGFIGYHLTRRFLSTGWKVITYDIQSHCIPFFISKWPQYIAYRMSTMQHGNLVSIRGDAADRGRLKEALVEHKPNIIVHLAALSIANVSNDYPEEAHRNILNTIITLLDVIRETKMDINRLVYTSSSMVYGNFLRDGNGSVIPANEEQQCNPIGIYGAMKLSGEYIVKAYGYRFGIPYSIVRPSAVYGPTDCNRRVTEIFLTNAIDHKAIVLDNGGRHQLDFTYVDDVVQGFYLASTVEEAQGQVFNITRGEGRTIRELAEIIQKLIPDTETLIEKVDIYRPNRGALDISRAKSILGYSPQFNLEDGMQKYYEFIKGFKGNISEC